MTSTVLSPVLGPEPGVAGELRDTERLIRLWHQKAFKFGAPPPATEFDFSRMVGGGDWGYRFVISADPVADDHAFLIYGSQLARLLELPEEPVSGIPITRQLPRRYVPLFADGCREAMAQAAPVRSSGAVAHLGQLELYRAAFMPLAGGACTASQLVFGSFNRRVVPKIWAADVFRQTDRLGADIRSERKLSEIG